MKFVKCELHSHTRHSDGDFTFCELCERAEKSDLDVLAITDHNTISTHEEIENYAGGLKLIKGMEWTSFFGHVLLLNLKKYYDWRDLTKTNLAETLRKVKADDENVLLALAHPADAGSPISTGSHFDYEIEDFGCFDYIEVWHGANPQGSEWSAHAKALWLGILDKGGRMTTCYGRDWHRDLRGENRFAKTLVLSASDSQADVLSAIKRGRVSVSLEPTFNLSLFDGVSEHILGDTVKSGEYRAKVTTSDWRDQAIKPTKIALFGERNALLFECPFEREVEFAINARGKFLRAELLGEVGGKECVIAFTNAIYIEE